MRVKDWAEDVRLASEAAQAAAGLPGCGERIDALGDLFRALGEASNRYACPHQAARVLVRIAVREYRAARAARVLEGVGA